MKRKTKQVNKKTEKIMITPTILTGLFLGFLVLSMFMKQDRGNYIALAFSLLVLAAGVAGTIDKSLDSGGANSNVFIGTVGIIYFGYRTIKKPKEK